MNIEEAKAILRAHSPGRAGAEDPEIVQALEAVSEDRELARWWAEESALDSKITANLAGEPLPADLRERILSGKASLKERAPSAPWWRGFGAMAAALAILVASAALWLHETHQKNPPTLAAWQSDSLETLNRVLSSADKLDTLSPDSSVLRTWLANKQDPSPAALPASLVQLKSLGCKTVTIGDRKVSIICFHTSATQLAHLVTVDAHGLEPRPPDRQPEFIRKGDWVTASWSASGQSFMLAMKGADAKATEEELRGLLPPTA